MKRTLITLVFLIIPFLSAYLSAEEVQTTGTISITSFGGEPNTGANMRVAFSRAVSYCKRNPGTRIVFPKGRYDFAPATDGDYVIKMSGVKNCTFDGQGSEFVFHGRCAVGHIVNCSGLTLKNFSVDWDRPFISQCTIERAGGGYLDVSIDKEKYPYVIQGDTILFKADNMPFEADNWALPVAGLFNDLYDKDSGNILYGTKDNPLGDIFHKRASVLSNGWIRFYGQHNGYNPPAGSVQSLYHGTYIRNCFDVDHCTDITFRNIPVYHCLSMTVMCTRSENITIDGIGPRVNERKGRYFSAISDAFHFINCKGHILIEHCAPTGQGDDMLNVCGAYLTVLSKTGAATVTLDRSSYTEAGDTVWLVNNKTYTRGETRVVKSVSKSGSTTFMTFDRALPEDLGAGWLIENKTWTPSVTVRHCKVLRKNRARGLLISTPRRVVVEDNYFSTAGTAILFGSYQKQWRESGTCEDVEIRRNTFDNCFTSPWGAAVITLEAPIAPASIGNDTYHNNVNIHDNVFRSFGTPLLNATGAGNLRFTSNKIISTTAYPALSNVEAAIVLNACRGAVVHDNDWDKDYTYTKVRTYNMGSKDLSNLTDYRSLLKTVVASLRSDAEAGTDPGFLTDRQVASAWQTAVSNAKAQASTATQLTAKSLLESLISTRKAADTAAVVPVTEGWYYILSGDSASENGGVKKALCLSDGAESPEWTTDWVRNSRCVWRICPTGQNAVVYDREGKTFSVRNYATDKYLIPSVSGDTENITATAGEASGIFFYLCDRAGRFLISDTVAGSFPSRFLIREAEGTTALSWPDDPSPCLWRLQRVPDDVVSAVCNPAAHREDKTTNVWTADGVLIKSAIDRDYTLSGLPRGIYIVGKRKVAVR